MASEPLIWIFLVFISIIVNISWRVFLKTKAGHTDSGNDIDHVVDYWFHLSEGNAVSLADVLSSWAQPARKQTKNIGAIRNNNLREFLGSYDRIEPDEYFRAIDSDLFQTYEDNEQYYQIGEWGDGSPILIHNVDDDAKIYIYDIESDVPGSPSVFASTMEKYLIGAWNYNQGAMRILREKGHLNAE